MSEQGGNERLFEKRHTHEIERAENLAAGVPPKARNPPAEPPPAADTRPREPNLETPAECRRKSPSRR